MNSLKSPLVAFAFTCIALLGMSAEAIAQKKKEIRPKKFVNLVYMKGSSDFVYYALSEKTKTTLEVEGPGKLIVYNRARLEKNEKQSTPYYLKYTIDNKKITSKKIGPQKRSDKIKYKKKLPGTPTKAEKEVIIIPPGKHTLNFYKYKAKHSAHVRFIYEKKDKIKWEELKNNDHLKKVNIQYTKTKKEQEYYRISDKRGFVFTSNNSKKLRVYLRADFDYKMHSQNIIRFVLKRNGEVVGTYKVTCKKSSTVENITDKKLVPGILERIFIDLPEGENHRYEIMLKDPNKSAIVRVFLDKNEKTIATAN